MKTLKLAIAAALLTFVGAGVVSAADTIENGTSGKITLGAPVKARPRNYGGLYKTANLNETNKATVSNVHLRPAYRATYYGGYYPARGYYAARPYYAPRRAYYAAPVVAAPVYGYGYAAPYYAAPYYSYRPYFYGGYGGYYPGAYSGWYW